MTLQLADRLITRWGGLRLPRRTIRLRLTAVYGGLFLASGAGLLTVTYVLVRRQYTAKLFITSGKVGAGVAVGAKSFTIGPQPEPPGATLLTPEQVVAQAHAQSSAALHQLLVQSGIALAIMALLSIWLGWLMAGRALRPLRTITNAAREISASNLHRRLALDGPDDELRQLGDTFDGLLGRLEATFEAQRRFVANASHELRTPLTLERALVEVALADPNATVDTLRRTCEQVLAAGEQQERLIEALLTLSRSQRGLDSRESVDLAAIAAQTLELTPHDRLRIGATLEPARTSGDPRLVERLVANLIGNAVQHNIPGGWIDVTTGTGAGRASITVANSGPVIPAGELDRLFQPFQRLDSERTSSSDGGRLGLGLSIVQAIAAAHTADVTAHARHEGGLQVEVGFPAELPSLNERVVPRGQDRARASGRG
jgi:signal transduction histidine kinase